MRDTLAVILAGGKGTRLEPLTRDRAKPAVPFGGNYRIIDFVLSNCLNSGLRKMLVLTQYKAMSLDRHINLGWRDFFCRELDEFIDIVPPQQRIDENWYQGTADAVYQNIYAIEKERPKYLVILAGDHIYKMNYHSMLQYHKDMQADLTIGALRVNCEEAKEFGVMQVDSDQRIVGFQEKPAQPRSIPNDHGHALASMGIYVFNTRFLFEQLCHDANDPKSHHDFGKNIIPSIIDRHRVFAFPFKDENRKQDAYWRDVGTLDAFYEANMDLLHPVKRTLGLGEGQQPIGQELHRAHQVELLRRVMGPAPTDEVRVLRLVDGRAQVLHRIVLRQIEEEGDQAVRRIGVRSDGVVGLVVDQQRVAARPQQGVVGEDAAQPRFQRMLELQHEEIQEQITVHPAGELAPEALLLAAHAPELLVGEENHETVAIVVLADAPCFTDRP